MHRKYRNSKYNSLTEKTDGTENTNTGTLEKTQYRALTESTKSTENTNTKNARNT